MTLVLITFRGVLDVHAPPDAASAAISFVAGVSNFSGVNLIVAISGFVGRGVRAGRGGQVRVGACRSVQVR